MFRVLLTALCFAACTTAVAAPSVEEQLEALQQELTYLKENQVAIARHVGLGGLVRPDTIDISQGHRIGSDDAEFVMVEFTDLHCPVCARFHNDIFPELKAGLIAEGKVLFVSNEFPLTSIHPNAPFAAMMLRCSAEQGKYDEAKTLLYAVRSEFDREFVDGYAERMELNKESYDACLENPETHQAIGNSIGYGQMLGLSATPTFIIGRKSGNVVTNYEILTGPVPVDRLERALEGLKK